MWGVSTDLDGTGGAREADRGSLVADEDRREAVAAVRAVQRLPRVGVEVAERLGTAGGGGGDARAAGLAVVGVLGVSHRRGYGLVAETDFAAGRLLRSMTRLAAVTFDLDDTLCRHDHDVDALYRQAFERAGVEPFGEPSELWPLLDGPPDPDDRVGYLGAGFARLAAQYGRDVDPVALAEAFEAVADESRVAYLPGASEALAAAAAVGPVGVLTNGPEERQRAKVAALGLDDRVDAVVYAGDLPRRKPHAEPFEQLAAAMSVDPAETLYVGNSLGYDVAGAHNAGLRSAWLRGDPEDAAEPYRPDYVVDSLEELARLLNEECESEETPTETEADR